MVDYLLGVPGKLKTLIDLWTSTKAGYLDASITSRATAAALTTVDSEVGLILQDTTELVPDVNAVLADTVVMQPLISSMSQYGTTVRNSITGSRVYAATAGQTTIDVTVGTLTDYTKAFVTFCTLTSNSSAEEHSLNAVPINSTTVRITKVNNTLATVTYYAAVTVVELY